MFICQRDEFGWTTYIDETTARTAGWRPELENMIRIPRPRWEVSGGWDEDGISLRPVIEEAIGNATRRVWEIEEEYLTSAVVELLRERGYTVIEPEPEIIIREHIQTYYS